MTTGAATSTRIDTASPTISAPLPPLCTATAHSTRSTAHGQVGAAAARCLQDGACFSWCILQVVHGWLVPNALAVLASTMGTVVWGGWMRAVCTRTLLNSRRSLTDTAGEALIFDFAHLHYTNHVQGSMREKTHKKRNGKLALRCVACNISGANTSGAKARPKLARSRAFERKTPT